MGTVTYAKLVTEHLQQFGMDSNQAETVLQHMKAHSRHEAMRGRLVTSGTTLDLKDVFS